MNTILSEKEWLLLRTEIREYFVHRRNLHLLPLLFLGIFLEAWIYPVGSPIAPALLITIAALEAQFNNIFYRTANELEAMALFPLAWERIVFVKNLATIALTFGLMTLTAMGLIYFSPDEMTHERWAQAIVYLGMVIFPLLHFGNAQSVKRPRKVTDLEIGDLVHMLWLLVNLLLISLPYYLLMNVYHFWIGCLACVIGFGWFWYRYSVKETGRQIEKEISIICSRL